MTNNRDQEGHTEGIQLMHAGSQDISDIMNAWRVRTLNTVLTVVVILGSVSIVTLFIRAIGDENQWPIALFFLACYITILFLASYRRLDWHIRGWGFLMIVYLVGITSLIRGGLAGAGREYLIIVPILATILVGVRAGVTTGIISLMVMVAFSLIADAGVLTDWLIYQDNPVDLASWVVEITYTSVLMGVSTSLLLLFNRRLTNLLVNERKTALALEHARTQLEEYNQTLSQKVDQRTAELAQANKVMELELKLAGNIQTSFMASELPRIAGWDRAAGLIPARQTSGDFYDIYPLGKGRFGILIADVVDKGVGAALIMAFCWALVHTYATRYPDRPDLVMQKINRHLFRDTHSDQFVTLFYGILDARKNMMVYCNAGHNPPFLFRNSETTPSVQPLVNTGIPLGILEGKTWTIGTVSFGPGDLLVLYTDGVTEAENTSNENFGSERLINFVLENCRKSPQEIHARVIQKLSDFTGNLSDCDDITLMILGCELQAA
jgi:serine phosphatase RsbU (regulator of sigma subunit)